MDQKNHHQCNHGGNNGSGFFLGLMVGVVLTLLLTTKKGRKMFRELTDEGMSKFSDFEKKLQNTIEEDEKVDEFDDEELEDEYVEPKERRPLPPEPVREVRHIAEEAKQIVHRATAPTPKRVVRERDEEVEEREEEPEHKAAVVHKSSHVRKFFTRKK